MTSQHSNLSADPDFFERRRHLLFSPLGELKMSIQEGFAAISMIQGAVTASTVRERFQLIAASIETSIRMVYHSQDAWLRALRLR